MAATDDFEGPALQGPGYNFFAISPNDSTQFVHITRGVYVGVTGNVAAVDTAGVVTTFVAVPAGTLLPIRCIRVNATNTTATSLVGIY